MPESRLPCQRRYAFLGYSQELPLFLTCSYPSADDWVRVPFTPKMTNETENIEWSDYIEAWLDTLIRLNKKRKNQPQEFQTAIRSRGREIPTPSLSNRSMSIASPKRRKLSGDDDDKGNDGDVFSSPQPGTHSQLDFDIDRTPTSQNSQHASTVPFRLSRPPTALRAPSTASSSQVSQNSSRRGNSPSKRPQSLRALEKPIEYVALEDDAAAQLPADMQSLYNRIYEITVEHDRFLPQNAREDVQSILRRNIRDDWFMSADAGEANADDVAQNEGEQHDASAELQALKQIESAARDSMRLGRSEGAWNIEVHGPLLDLALSRHRCVMKEYVTTSQIAPAFIPPTTGGGNLVTGKMVDFVLVLAPDDEHSSVADTKFANLIHRTVLAQPGGVQYINQTQYPPLQFRPISVSIETKASGSAEEGKLQLGVWSAAWHQRMRALLDSGATKSTDGERRIITLPLLLVVGHEWKIFFACDRGDHIDIVGDMSIGDTKNIIGLYTVMAVLAELARWSTSVFGEWITDVLTSIDLDSA